MSEEEKKAIKYLKENSKEGSSFWCYEAIPNIKKVLKLIDKQQKEIEQLKYLITKATKIIDEYANETEKDTKKLIEYQEKFIQELLEGK